MYARPGIVRRKVSGSEREVRRSRVPEIKSVGISSGLNGARHVAVNDVVVTSSTIGQGVTFWDEQLAELRSDDDIAAYLGPPSRTARAQRVGWLFKPSTSAWPRSGWPIVWDELSDQETIGVGGVGGGRAVDDISFRELRANLSVQHVTTTVDGDVRIALCKIGGDLSLTNLRAAGQRLVLEGLDIDGDLVADWTGRRYTDAHTSPPDSWLQNYVGLLSTTAAILTATLCTSSSASGAPISGTWRCR